MSREAGAIHYDALDRPNRTVKIRRPCVTVTYLEKGEATHHIDLAVYTTNAFDQTEIGKGRESDAKAERVWEVSEAQELNTTIIDRFPAGSERDQFRRAVRALKRWRDLKFGHKNIPSIGLTVAAYQWFVPKFDGVDADPRDIYAIRDLLNMMLSNWSNRLRVLLPVAPYSDLFENMTDIQMADFKTKLTELRDALNDADAQPDTHEACKILKAKFGDDFPVPEKTDTTTKATAGVTVSGRSA